ncbi:FAD-dependent oxidoreductase [Pseudomonas gingeri]
MLQNNVFSYDAIVIGGGFYGSAIAIYLAKQRGVKRVALLERERSIMTRASYNNQARVHNGYHYPRSFTTAYRSRINFPKFISDWPQAIKKDFRKLYAISRRNSKVTSRQFERFCKEIGASIEVADSFLAGLFEPRLIENVFLVEEYAFDTTVLVDWALKEIYDAGVEVHYECEVKAIEKNIGCGMLLSIENSAHQEFFFQTKNIFNCTYSGLNQLKGAFPNINGHLKQEITEMALMQMPKRLEGLGITVMDGPFFSLMPFPARHMHTLSHVRYTPHRYWQDVKGKDPYIILDDYEKNSRVNRMIRDVERYFPAIADAKYMESMFELKTVLLKSESDDSRPILFESHLELPGCYSILGGKIDNIYDVLERLDRISLL